MRSCPLRILAAIATIVPLSVCAAAEPPKTAPHEIRQGGYVEKVNPNVDYKDRLPRIPPRSPAESMKAFHIEPGFRLDQVAAEPLTCSCVDLCFDENGRLFVAEMVPYAENNSSAFGSPSGRVVMLEDTDGDGIFDRATVYVDKLVWPTGLTWCDGGLFIVAAPDILYCKDTQRDGKTDVREVIATGFSISNPSALPNSLRWGLDHRIHGMTSTAGGQLTVLRWAGGGNDRKTAPVQSRGRDFSIHPRTGELRLDSGGSQFGMTYDVWGRKFESSNSAPIEMVMYEDHYIARNPYLAAPSPRKPIWVDGMTVYRTSPPEPWRVLRTEMRKAGIFSGSVEGGGSSVGYFTSACGLTIYTGNAWPAAYQNSALVCEGASNLVHHMRLEPDGIAMTAHRSAQKREFLTSEENWFRPIQFTNAPDGCLYLVDMYREVYEHPDAVPPSAKKYIDLSTGKDRGRVYRIAPEGFKSSPMPRLGRLTTPELVKLIEHPNGWHRETAGRLLYERQDRAAIAPLVRLAAESSSPLGRMHAMYALDGLEALGAEVVIPRLSDSHPRVREHAVRLAEKVVADSPAVRERLYAMANDEDSRVRYQLAFTLGEIPGSQATAALARIAARDGADPWVRLAVLSSCLGRAGELLAILTADATWRTMADSPKIVEALAEQAGLQNRSDQAAEVFRVIDGLGKDTPDLARALVRGLTRGLQKSGSALRTQLAGRGGSSVAGRLLAEMIAQAKARAADEKQPVDRRVEAIHALALTSFREAADILPGLLDSRQPQDVQTATLATLGRFREPEVGPLVVNAWQGFTPQVRSVAAETLFSRPELLAVLLRAVEDKKIAPAQLDPARVQYLLTHADPKIRDRAASLMGGVKLARREEVVAAYRDVLRIPGSRSRGKGVFRRECSKCHELEGVGHNLGLPLNSVQNRGAEAILVAVLDPNRDIQPQYFNYVIVTNDGQSITGMVAAETATSITLRRSEKELDTILRTNIDQMQNSGLSLMPEGLEKQLSKQDLADAIAYLLSVK